MAFQVSWMILLSFFFLSMLLLFLYIYQNQQAHSTFLSYWHKHKQAMAYTIQNQTLQPDLHAHFHSSEGYDFYEDDWASVDNWDGRVSCSQSLDLAAVETVWDMSHLSVTFQDILNGDSKTLVAKSFASSSSKDLQSLEKRLKPQSRSRYELSVVDNGPLMSSIVTTARKVLQDIGTLNPLIRIGCSSDDEIFLKPVVQYIVDRELNNHFRTEYIKVRTKELEVDQDYRSLTMLSLDITHRPHIIEWLARARYGDYKVHSSLIVQDLVDKFKNERKGMAERKLTPTQELFLACKECVDFKDTQKFLKWLLQAVNKLLK